MIRISNVSKRFGSQQVLNNISLDIHQGEIFVILGESGTGKSVLLKHLIGLLKPDSGKIELDGEDITQLSEREMLKRRKKIGYLFQEGALYDFMNVYENLAFPLKEHTKLKKDAIKDKVDHILKLVDLQGVGNKFPSELSGGMKKRVGLARALILDSKILFCDEPTSGLDPIRSRDISDLIKKVSNELKCTTVITSHDIQNSFRIADRIALLQNGKFIVVGTVQELRKSDQMFVKEFIN
ncbi:MAG: ABC transporter ATP-binding protein [Candidatus Omnitrophica bacterium]|nr:ABC transporter ATP-binding protein [Candidatus Omnitrophota bacterium]